MLGGTAALYDGAAKVGKVQARVGMYLSFFVTALLATCTAYLMFSKRDPKETARDKWTKVGLASFATFIMAVVTWFNAWMAKNNGNPFKKAMRASQGASLAWKLI